MKGILFKPWKIKAIAESSPDREWQTRRVIKPQLISHSDGWWSHQVGRITTSFQEGEQTPEMIALARYQIGEVVYIKEAYWQDQSGGVWGYKLDGIEWPPLNCGGKAISPMFMPERFARYFIKFTDVRVERLQEITEQGAKAEGVSYLQSYNLPEYIEGFRGGFKELWNSINANRKVDITTNLKTVYPYSWEANPWDFAYSFRRQETPKQ